MELAQVLMVALAAPVTYLVLFILQRVERQMAAVGPAARSLNEHGIREKGAGNARG